MAGNQQSNASKGHWGGRRPGAGRKRKGHQPPTVLTDVDVKAAQAHPVPSVIEPVAQQRARSALDSLVKIMLAATGEQARVNAACAVLDRAYGKPVVELPDGPSLLPFMAAPGVAAGRVQAEIRDEARRNAVLAIEVLHIIATRSESEGARVSAARALLDRGLGLVAPAKVPDDVGRPLGKREQQAADARAAATGIFATPPAPTASEEERGPLQ